MLVLPCVPEGQVCQLLEVAISTVGAMLLLAPSEKMDGLWLRHGQCCSLETKPAPALEASGQLTTESGISAPNRPSRTQTAGAEAGDRSHRRPPASEKTPDPSSSAH